MSRTGSVIANHATRKISIASSKSSQNAQTTSTIAHKAKTSSRTQIILGWWGE